MNITRRQLMGGALALILAPLVGCAAQGEELRRTVFAFDTVCTFGGLVDESVLDEAEGLCVRYESLFSATLADSDVSRINRAQGVPCEVDPDTADLIGRALAFCEASGGLFDITIGAVSSLWDFHEGVVPAADEIERALAHVGWEGVSLTGNQVRLKDPEAALDLGGIAKGYIADRLVELFSARGARSAFVNLGGNVCVLGDKPDGTPWAIGVRDPWDPSGTASIARLSSSGGSVVTSGLYERSFEDAGRTYWHILDPRTGYPVEGDLVSVTVASSASITGDGLTKPPFMLGVEEGLAFLERNGAEGLVVSGDGSVRQSAGQVFEQL